VKIECGSQDPNQKISPSKILRLRGPIIPLRVGPPLNPNAPAPPAGQVKNVNALIDTGASDSCIDNALAKSLSLKVIDCRPFGGVAGKADHDIYLGQIIVDNLRMQKNGRLVGVEMGGTHTQMIVGRDFLDNLIMIYDGASGTVTLAR
jgi:hypothetical protein